MLDKFKDFKFDIIFQGGQSNADGCGFGESKLEFIPNDKIYYLIDGANITVAQERAKNGRIFSDFSLTFADQYINNGFLEGERKLLIIRSARGGTGFSDKRWGINDDLYLNMIQLLKIALDLNGENRLKVFLWHQGEREARYNATYQFHYSNLTNLITDIRERFGSNLPFIAGNFVPEWISENNEICEPIISAMRDVCSRIKNAGFVETENLLSNSQKNGGGDKLHFSRESLHELGIRYFEAYKNIGEY